MESCLPEEGITPGYAAALRSSPKLLVSMCRHYFRHYDSNKNDLLECGEVLILAQDLSSFLAVPLGSDEPRLQASVAEFSGEGRDALCLSEFCQWFPSILGLEPPNPELVEAHTSKPPPSSAAPPLGGQAAAEAAADGADGQGQALPALARGRTPVPSLERVITPGYVAALMGSPNLLCSLCQQYFQKYDANANGSLECSELIVLAEDLSSSVAVPLDADPERMKRSIARFSADGQPSLRLEEFCRWFPMVLGLEPLSPEDLNEAGAFGLTAGQPA